MRYDWNESIPHEEFSREFYRELERRFYSAVRLFAPWKAVPFDFLIDFDGLKTKDVLEIGCGNGSHGQLLATHAKSYKGIDITDYAVKSTSARMRIFGLNGTVLKMDAEQMQFPDNSFDFIWSWGGIHHSADTSRIRREMNRVLRPGGTATVMVYHRGFRPYHVYGAFGALMRGKLPTPATTHRCVQLSTDGALARYYSPSDWRRLVRGLFKVGSVRIYGQKERIVFPPGGKIKDFVLMLIPNWLTRFSRYEMRNGIVPGFRDGEVVGLEGCALPRGRGSFQRRSLPMPALPLAESFRP